MGPKEWYDLGKTVLIMLQICEPIFGIVIDSGFCVKKGVKPL